MSSTFLTLARCCCPLGQDTGTKTAASKVPNSWPARNTCDRIPESLFQQCVCVCVCKCWSEPPQTCATLMCMLDLAARQVPVLRIERNCAQRSAWLAALAATQSKSLRPRHSHDMHRRRLARASPRHDTRYRLRGLWRLYFQDGRAVDALTTEWVLRAAACLRKRRGDPSRRADWPFDPWRDARQPS